MIYEHTQRGRLTLLVSGFLIFIGAVSIPTIYRDDPSAGFVLAGAIAVIIATVVVFNRLTVVVTDREVAAIFGWGWPKKMIEFGDVAAVRRVRNKWIYGWGSRWIPGGWMFNVYGRDAIELDLTSGRRFRIGTDEPEQLLAAFPPQFVRH